MNSFVSFPARLNKVKYFIGILVLAAISLSSSGKFLQPAKFDDVNTSNSLFAQTCVEGFDDDFSNDPNISEKWRIYRYSNDKTNEAVWNEADANFSLTRAASNKAVAAFADYRLIYTRWEASFKYKAGGGSGADGFVFMFYKDETKYGVPGYGGYLGFQFALGSGIPGYGIEFDNFYNPDNDIGDPSANHIALIQDKVGNHLSYIDDMRTEDDQWHDVSVEYDDGQVKVMVDNNEILDYLISQPVYMYSGIGFSSATATYDNNHIIDNFVLSVDCNSLVLPNKVYLPFIQG